MAARLTQTWLNTLPEHPIFSPPPDFDPPKTAGKRQTLVIVRSTELIVAVASQLRLAHLGEVKSGTGSSSYKVDIDGFPFQVAAFRCDFARSSTRRRSTLRSYNLSLAQTTSFSPLLGLDRLPSLFSRDEGGVDLSVGGSKSSGYDPSGRVRTY
jgi:hypothetical protein